jgi:hypothetical protein
MDHLDSELSYCDDLAVCEVACGFNRWDEEGAGKAISAGVFEVICIGLVDIEGDLEQCHQLRAFCDVIPMGVGEEDHLNGESLLLL